MLEDFSSPLIPVETSSKQNITKQTQAFKDTTDQKELIDIYTTFHLKAGEQFFFSSAHGTFSRINHILDHISSLGKFEKIEIVSSFFPTTMI